MHGFRQKRFVAANPFGARVKFCLDDEGEVEMNRWERAKQRGAGGLGQRNERRGGSRDPTQRNAAEAGSAAIGVREDRWGSESRGRAYAWATADGSRLQIDRLSKLAHEAEAGRSDAGTPHKELQMSKCTWAAERKGVKRKKLWRLWPWTQRQMAWQVGGFQSWRSV